ncbi:hypothetical protein ACFQ51_04545 [Streptomyces kaempferi]
MFGPSLVRGTGRIHLLMDPRTGRRLEIGPKEHFIIARLDGSRSLDEIGHAYAGEFGARLGEAQWGRMLRLLHGRDLLDGAPGPTGAPGRPARPHRPAQPRHRPPCLPPTSRRTASSPGAPGWSPTLPRSWTGCTT